jgi:hypothetical protein
MLYYMPCPPHPGDSLWGDPTWETHCSVGDEARSSADGAALFASARAIDKQVGASILGWTPHAFPNHDDAVGVSLRDLATIHLRACRLFPLRQFGNSILDNVIPLDGIPMSESSNPAIKVKIPFGFLEP